MVLSSIVLSIRGLLRRIQLETLTSSSGVRPDSAAAAPADSETNTAGAMMDDIQHERGMAVLQQHQPPLFVVPAELVAASAAVPERGERGERGVERGFMMAARVATSTPTTVSRTASSKRKLEELEIGLAESSASANSQVRARRESAQARDVEVLDGGSRDSIAESSGRERYDGGMCVSSEAQALDGETEMREEAGNEAVDADAMWEEEPGWNKIVGMVENVAKSITDDRLEDVFGVSTTTSTEGTPSLTSAGGRSRAAETFSSLPQVDSIGPSVPGDMLIPSLGGVAMANLADSVLSSEVGSTGRSGILSDTSDGRSGTHSDGGSGRSGGVVADEDSAAAAAAGKDGELSKEAELDGARVRDRDSSRTDSSSVFGHEEGPLNRRFGSSTHTAVIGGATGPDSVGSSINASNVSSLAAASVNTKTGDIGADASSSGSRPMIIDPPANPARLQFFVRTYIGGRTVVLHATASDSIESVHQQILRRTGLPVSEQRLIFGGRQLQHDQTLESCNVVNDATLNLVARMRSTALPHSWQLINDLVATIRRMCAAEDSQAPQVKLLHLQDTVRASVQEFLKMASKSVPVSEHMQVFQLAGATSALVMLLLSQVDSNRECAEESITSFLQANDEYLPAQIHCHCASVLLDFCKLLSKSAPNHSLYSSCRNALARLLDTVGIAHGSPYFYEAKADSIVHDFSPFVNELSVRLSVDLQWIAKAYTTKDVTLNFASYMKEAKDFTAFVIPLCKAMEVCKGIDLSGSSPNCGRRNDGPSLRFSKNDGMMLSLGFVDVFDGHSAGIQVESTASATRSTGAEIGTHTWLRTLFLDLLQEIEKCLKSVEEVAEKSLEGSGTVTAEDRERPLGWAPFLVILKGLHAIAKLYEGTMDELLKVLGKRSIALNMLIRQSRWNDDDFWLLDHKSLLDFESKRRLVMAMLPEPQDDHDERQEIIVHRSQLLTESFEMLAYVEPEALQGGISVEFSTEEATGPGVLREWFSMICREIFNCQNALFLPCPKDRRRFFPNPASGVNPGHLTYFRFCGRVIALALMHRVQVDVVFAVTFFKQLAGLPISWEDAKDADPVLYESCKKILEMDPETIDSDALGLTFVSEVEELGTRKTLELCQGGRDMVVNSENRRQFVELLVHRRLVASVAEQIKSFSQGFSDLLVNASSQQFLRAVDPEDLDLLLYGKDRNIDLDDWKMHTEYHDYTLTDDQIKWFWQVVKTMTPEQRRRLLFFSTSVTHLPAEGFAGLSSKFHIHRAHTDTSWLPTAHTCFYQLVLPPYPTYEIMHTRLYAIAEVHIAEGFGFA
ncbi:unnamed protein product [Calypogeia fissa]